jgi:hypothetical protein
MIGETIIEIESHPCTDMLIPNHENHKYIVVSSFFFLCSGCYACYLKLYWFGLYNCITGLISMNHWRKPMYGIRRRIDIYNARVYFCVSIFALVRYIHDIKLQVILGLILVIAVMFFRMSEIFRETITKYQYWYRYHFMFHFITNLDYCILFYFYQK